MFQRAARENKAKFFGLKGRDSGYMYRRGGSVTPVDNNFIITSVGSSELRLHACRRVEKKIIKQKTKSLRQSETGQAKEGTE